MRKGQGRKPKLNNLELRSLRRHCIRNRHSSISDISTFAQDYFGKPLSSTTIRSYINKCQLKLYCAKRKPYVNRVQKRCRLLWALRHLGWTLTQWKCVLWSDKSVFQVFFGRNGRRVLRTKEEKDHPDCYQGLSWYRVVSVPLAKVTYISVIAPLMPKSRDFRAIYAAFKMSSFPGMPMHISTRQCKTTFCTHYKGMAAEEECAGA